MPTPSRDVSAFIASLALDRRREFEHVRRVIGEHLPSGYVETIAKGMLAYVVPLEVYAGTYNGEALWYVALASEKSYLSLHLMPVYGSPALAKRLTDGFAKAGKKLDMGKACVRFQKADDLALDTIGDIVAAVPLEDWVRIAKQARSTRRRA